MPRERRPGRGLLIAALVVVAAGGVGVAVWSRLATAPRSGSVGGPSPADIAVGPNLVPNPSFEASTQLAGLADGLGVWGSATPSIVAGPVSNGGQAQRIDVAPGNEGGVFFELPATAGQRYVQSLDAEALALAPGASLDMILEFYDANMTVLGYRVASIRSAGTRLARRAQSATAPLHTTRMRYVVNVAGGGSAVIDDARLQRAR